MVPVSWVLCFFVFFFPLPSPHLIHGSIYELSPACSRATLSLFSTHSASFKSCIGYKICLFFSPSWVAKHSRRNSVMGRIDALYICTAFFQSSLGFYISTSFYLWFAHSPVSFRDCSKTRSFPWVHHSPSVSQRRQRPLNMNSTFLPLICTLKAAPIFLLLQVLRHQSSFAFFFPPYSFSLFSFSSDVFILIIGMFMALAIGERRKKKKTVLRASLPLAAPCNLLFVLFTAKFFCI